MGAGQEVLRPLPDSLCGANDFAAGSSGLVMLPRMFGQLILQGTASAFDLSVNLQVVVSAQNGDLVAAPNVPFGGLATITVFSNPHLTVEGVSGQPAPGGFTATATGQLR